MGHHGLHNLKKSNVQNFKEGDDLAVKEDDSQHGDGVVESEGIVHEGEGAPVLAREIFQYTSTVQVRLT